jgi:hypothetical protein
MIDEEKGEETAEQLDTSDPVASGGVSNATRNAKTPEPLWAPRGPEGLSHRAHSQDNRTHA